MNDLQLIAENVTTTGAQPTREISGQAFTIQAIGSTTSGTGSAVINIEVSNMPNPSPTVAGHWLVAGTITLTLGTAPVDDGLSIAVPWDKMRANVTTLTGTGATVQVYGCGG